MTTNGSNNSLTLTSSGGSSTNGIVTGIGGDFYNTDAGDNFLGGPVSLTLHFSDGQTYSYMFTPTSVATSFVAFGAFTPGSTITSIVENAPSTSNAFATVSSFTLGTAVVPEPSSIVLTGLAGAIGLVFARARRKTANA